VKTLDLTPELYQYVQSHCPSPNAALSELANVTKDLPMGRMQNSPDQGTLLNLLAKIVGAKKIIEVGCFTGYSAISMASALGPNGKLVTLDIDPKMGKIAQSYFEKSGLKERIDLRIGEATSSLVQLEKEWGAQTADLMFIDADKENMLTYYEAGLRLLRPGGLIVADNVLWGGSVINPLKTDSSTEAIRRFNDFVREDERVDRTMLHVSDGLYVCRKR
jgi:predicted O-methyltransferase YrrM